MRLDAAIADAVERLSTSSESPRLDAEILLCLSIDMPRSYLFAHPEDELDRLSLERFEALLQRRALGEPIAYITGTQEFWSIPLQVSPATLIPRAETELLVELALGEIPKDAASEVLDLGTGSGAIAIAIASERPLCAVTASDHSDVTLMVAKENARQLSLANITFVRADWTAEIHGRKYDLIVSNPPYIREDDDALDKLTFEPLEALTAGPDGLDDIRVLAADCPRIAGEKGWLMLEHGAEQQRQVADILKASGWVDVTCHNDLAGKPRVTVAHRNGT